MRRWATRIACLGLILFMAACSVGQCVSGRAEHQKISFAEQYNGIVTLTAPAGTNFALCVW